LRAIHRHETGRQVLKAAGIVDPDHVGIGRGHDVQGHRGPGHEITHATAGAVDAIGSRRIGGGTRTGREDGPKTGDR
jgi:hypothetical protein